MRPRRKTYPRTKWENEFIYINKKMEQCTLIVSALWGGGGAGSLPVARSRNGRRPRETFASSDGMRLQKAPALPARIVRQCFSSCGGRGRFSGASSADSDRVAFSSPRLLVPAGFLSFLSPSNYLLKVFVLLTSLSASFFRFCFIPSIRQLVIL